MKIKVKEAKSDYKVITVNEKKQEAAGKPVTLKIKNGRVHGLTYEMMKACVESDDVLVYSDSTGPFGEDEGAMVISCNPRDAEGEYDLGDGDVERPEDCQTLVVFDCGVGQSDCNWSGFDEDEGNEGENICIHIGDLPKAVELWIHKGLI